MKYSKNNQGLMQPSINKIEYLNGMKGRLINDVEPYLKLCWEINQENDRSIGFWAMIRLLAPVVESLGQVKYPLEKESWISSSAIFKELGVPYPLISWKLFRDCLIHSDEMMNVINDEKELYSGWQITFGGGHIKNKLQPVIDVDRLFYGLLKLIEKTASASNKDDVVNFRAIRFNKKQLAKNADLQTEYNDLFS